VTGGRPAIRGLVGVVAFLLVWEAFGRSGAVRPELLPPPSTVLATLSGLLADPAFLVDVLTTLASWAAAVALAVLIAVPSGLVLGSVAPIRTATRSLVEFLRPVPSVALIPLVVVVLGRGPETTVTLACYAAVWPLLLTTSYAMGEIDPVQTDTARAFGLSPARRLFTVALPHAAPFIMTALRVSAGIALVLVVSTELLGAGTGGLGRFVFLAGSGGGQMDAVLAGTLTVGLLGCAVNAGLELLHRRFLGWDTGEPGG
jgi:NitT/TauT family transport system permease protein